MLTFLSALLSSPLALASPYFSVSILHLPPLFDFFIAALHCWFGFYSSFKPISVNFKPKEKKSCGHTGNN